MRNLRLPLLAALAALAIALVLAHGAPASTAKAVEPDGDLLKAIRHYRRTTLTLQRVMGHRVRFRLLRRVSLGQARTVWRHRAVATRVRFLRGPAHKRAWLCIHRYEGAWTDGGSPYYGGLQMDFGFQSSYGSALLSTKGTADHWSPLEQMWVAERAYRAGRGFYPWPNTARYCGLI
jgi:hypothetical protein